MRRSRKQSGDADARLIYRKYKEDAVQGPQVWEAVDQIEYLQRTEWSGAIGKGRALEKLEHGVVETQTAFFLLATAAEILKLDERANVQVFIGKELVAEKSPVVEKI